jgi:TolA-binding protein
MKYIFFFSSILFIVIFSTCSKKNDDYYMTQADKAIQQNDINGAVQAYQNLIKEYPQSPKAPEATFKLASFYQNKMVKKENLSDTLSLEKSAKLYRSIFDQFPNDKNAAKSLFMSGFILANDLKKYNEATATFVIFLQKFPDNELAFSVREELNNMGLTPSEILDKKKNSND